MSVEFSQVTQSAHILSAGVFLHRSRKPTAATRCMCPLYDTNRQAWIQLQPMNIARVGHGVIAAGKCQTQSEKFILPA